MYIRFMYNWSYRRKGERGYDCVHNSQEKNEDNDLKSPNSGENIHLWLQKAQQTTSRIN